MYRSSSVSNRFQDVETTIRGLTKDLSMAFNTGNYDQMAGAFAPDGIVMAPNRGMARRSVSNAPGVARCGFNKAFFQSPVLAPHAAGPAAS